MKTKIKEWLAAGKSQVEVSSLILAEPESKSLDAEQLTELVLEGQKAVALEASLKVASDKVEAKKVETESAKKLKEEIAEGVKSHLKSINVDPIGSLRPAKITQRFDYAAGKMVAVDSAEFSEGYKATNELIRALANKDPMRVKSISDEIAQDNVRFGTKAVQRSDSDTVGGYSIPTEVENTIAQLSYAQSVMLPKVNKNVIIFEDKIYPTIGAVEMGYLSNQDTTITESNATFSNPTINMERVGAFTRLSNTLLKQKGVDLTNALSLAYASAWARFIDEQ
mgnify:CR=1 FL=1